MKTKDLKAILEPLCSRVLEHFQLPAQRLLCFFDDVDPLWFTQYFPSACRGFHAPVIGTGYISHDIQRLFFDSLGNIVFDNVIYLPSRTFTTETGAVITFSHELQHFVQYGTAYKAWAASTLLCKHLRTFEPATTAQAWNIPHEQDAMIVSKRIAELAQTPWIRTQRRESLPRTMRSIGCTFRVFRRIALSISPPRHFHGSTSIAASSFNSNSTRWTSPRVIGGDECLSGSET
ncbi:MAG TPA: hypothetical protein VGP62_10320 [Bryobacteraceae bacterium]|nr:hypothetical protein [Bryobacteraceae bacterium]